MALPRALVSLDDDQVRQFARRKAESCQGSAVSLDPPKRFRQLAAKAEAVGLVAPVPGKRGITVDGAIARLEDAAWWHRQLGRAIARAVEQQKRVLGLVHQRGSIYVSGVTLSRHESRKNRNRELLACMEAMNELGEVYTLAQLAECSLSNPRIRRSELMARMAGFEQIARELGHAAEFYTLTAPRRMHCRHANSGGPVDGYDGSRPDEVQAYLGRQWAKIRASLKRNGLQVYGLRVAEPHHDGTPHAHFLLFMEVGSREAVRETLRRYALEVDGNEPGAERHRFRVEPIDWSRGTATGYVAKYVSKNVDGYGLDDDGQGTPAEAAARRIEAWARVWGIRQFQQIGGPPVSIWRELRRADNAESEILEQARQAADTGDWATFLRLMQGPLASRHELPVQLEKVWSDEPGRYKEPKGDQVIGVRSGKACLVTRVHTWSIEPMGAGRDKHYMSRPAGNSESAGAIASS